MKKTNRFLAMLLTMVLCISELGSTGITVFAAGDDTEGTDAAEVSYEAEVSDDIDADEPADDGDYKKSAENTRFGIADWADPVAPVSDEELWMGSYVYYGYYEGMPVKCRVLDKETTDYNEPGGTAVTMLLNSDRGILKIDFGANKSWNDSNVKESLNSNVFLDSIFSYTQRMAINPSYKSAKSSTDGKSISRSNFTPLNGEELFLLDEAEVKSRVYGFPDHDEGSFARKNQPGYDLTNTWWLRSTEKNNGNFAEAVYDLGFIYKTQKDEEHWAAPAFNVDTSQILFSTAVEGNRGEIGTCYKLTLIKNSCTLSFPLFTTITVKDNVVYVPYWKTQDTRDVSVMILDGKYVEGSGKDNTANILYYEKLNTLYDPTYSPITDTTEKGGTFHFPSELDIDKWGEDYFVYLIPGISNGAQATDYAGRPIAISAGVLSVIREYTVDFDMNGGGSPEPGSRVVRGGSRLQEPMAPSRDGYAFGGWYTTKDCKPDSKYYFSSAVNGNLTLYAKWRKICNVSFDANGGTGSMETVTVIQGDYFSLPECEFKQPLDDKGRDEMSFAGWEIKGSKYSAGFKKYVDDDMVIKAVWDHLDYKDVIFYDKYGDTADFRVKYLDTVDKPEDPYHEGYTFLGWYTYKYGDNLANDKDLYDFSQPVRGNLTLYAAYTDDTIYHISISPAPGCVVTVDKEYVKIHDTVTITVAEDPYYELWFISRVPVKLYNKYQFINVYPEDLTDGKFTFEFPDMSSAPAYERNISISAFFNVKEDHEHTWEYHEGIRGNCHDGGKYGFAECTVCHHRYAWNTWKDEILYDITDKEDPYIYMMGYHGYIEGREYIEAKAPTCTVSGNIAYTYCKDCGKCLIGPNYIIEGTMEDVIIPIDEDAHDWDEASVSYIWGEDKRTVTASCSCKNDPSHVVNEEVNVNISYIKEPTCEEGGIARLTTEPFYFRVFTEQKLDIKVDKLGHSYSEPDYVWSDDLSQVTASVVCQNDSAHKEEETVSTTVTDKERYTEYTAVFTNDLFDDQTRHIAQVCFDANGHTATGMPETIKTDTRENISRPAAVPSSAGLKFIDWYEDAGCTTVYDFTKPVMRNTVIYAGWADENAKLFTVSFNMMGHGRPVASVVVESGKQLNAPATPVDPGWGFDGWYTEETLQNKYDFSKAVTADLTLFAKWTEKTIPVSGSRSALDPVPEIQEHTTDIYLVKGQKFNIGAEWSFAKGDGESKKYVSISKKGLLTAKKAGNAVIVCGERELNVHVFKPSIKKSLKLEAGQTTDNVIELKDYDADNMTVLWYSDNPDAATVEDGRVSAVAKGKAKITAYINGSAYNCTVSVSEKNGTAQNRTMHVATGDSKTISVNVKGVKKLDWKSASENVAVIKKKKVTAVNTGRTVLSASANGTEYTIDFYAEDLTVTGEEGKFAAEKGANKYSLNLTTGQDTQIHMSGSLDRPVVFKSSKPLVAFIDENGKIEARSAGKAKLTAKVDGKTITINVVIK